LGGSEIKSYRDLRVWQEAVNLAALCYALTKRFPKDELFGLTSQIRRAAASVPANIAEGHGREAPGNFVQFLRVAQGSLKEVETHLLLCERVGITKQTTIAPLLMKCEETGKMLRALIRAMQDKK
jgi:four helix bundle protein